MELSVLQIALVVLISVAGGIALIFGFYLHYQSRKEYDTELKDRYNNYAIENSSSRLSGRAANMPMQL